MYKDHPQEHWKSALEEIEKKTYTKKEAQTLYAEGKLKNGEIFVIKGAESAAGGMWICAVFMSGKLIYAKYSQKDRRLDTLKLKGIAHLMDIVKREWADTRQAPWLPPRVQNIANPELVIYGSKSNQNLEYVLGDGKGDKVIADSEKLMREMEDVKVDIA